MIVDFQRASDFVPTGLDAAKWPNLEPLYLELIARDLHCVRCVEKLILDRSELDAAASEAQTNLSINMTCHTDDEAANAAYLAFVEDVQPKLREVGFELDKKIALSPYAKDLDPVRYAVLLRDLKANVDVFRPENIPIETEISKLDQEYSQICGKMTVTFRNEEKTLPQLAKFNEETDRATREEAWLLAARRRYQDTQRLDEIFEQMIALRHKSAINAGFKNYRDYTWVVKKRFDYTPKTCHEYAQAVEAHATPLLRSIAASKAKALGLSALRPWDAQVDALSRPPLRPFNGAGQLVEGTSRIFRKIDPSLADLFDYLRDDKSNANSAASSSNAPSSCLDLESRKGKAPGGYQAGRERIRKPFIFMNAAGVQRDVETLLHEGGHAFHSLLLRSEPVLAYRAEMPMEIAEVASMSMELVAHPFLGEFYSPVEAQRARRNHLEALVNVLTSVAIIDQFQHWIYENPTHSREERHKQYAILTQRFGPGHDWSGLEQYLLTGWQRILHLYGVPFYYIEYGIAQLGALQVWMNYRQNPAKAVSDYKRALALGGSRPLPELFAAAGCQFDFGPANIKRLMDEVASELSRLPV